MEPIDVSLENAVIRDPFDPCFLCEPERWRTILERKHVRLIAGLGPLCPGYVILAPRQHIHTSAELPEDILTEFIDTAQLAVGALVRHYGEGYTAYEHAKIGACHTLEMQKDFTTFCHHCHRVFIPRLTHGFSKLAEWLPDYIALPQPDAVRELRGRAYVFYETGDGHSMPVRRAYVAEDGLPSQFMRRILSQQINLGRDWNWNAEPRYEEMIVTAKHLREEFAKG